MDCQPNTQERPSGICYYIELSQGAKRLNKDTCREPPRAVVDLPFTERQRPKTSIRNAGAAMLIDLP
jgi:hypothetical protein